MLLCRKTFGRSDASNRLLVELLANRKLANDSQLLTVDIKRKLKRRFARDIELWKTAAK